MVVVFVFPAPCSCCCRSSYVIRSKGLRERKSTLYSHTTHTFAVTAKVQTSADAAQCCAVGDVDLLGILLAASIVSKPKSLNTACAQVGTQLQVFRSQCSSSWLPEWCRAPRQDETWSDHCYSGCTLDNAWAMAQYDHCPVTASSSPSCSC
jgi:hypothetical protein